MYMDVRGGENVQQIHSSILNEGEPENKHWIHAFDMSQ